ncbi:MAG: tetratricopeptide repeat protein [Nitrospina sp.]|jgi:tetratricopeptide (TPR) repeat protein|nr:tetratricopeptide repeat protein [Nitrospina sp.]
MKFKINYYFNNWKILNSLLVLVTLLLVISCTNIDEHPLTLRIGAEPSAKMRNDIGIEHFEAGRNMDALLQFNQANFADPTSGEIHFNLGLALWNENKKKRAIKHFKQARILAKGNPKILESPVVNQILKEN